jgi:hypothetical protein
VIDVIAVVLIIMCLAAGLCGHATQPLPVRGVGRWLRTALRSRQAARTAPNRPSRDSNPVAPAPRPSQAPLWARNQPHTYKEAA